VSGSIRRTTPATASAQDELPNQFRGDDSIGAERTWQDRAPYLDRSGSPLVGFLAGVESYNAIAAASATFDTSTDMLAFLDASKDNVGNMDFAGMPAG
jgi:hypothetical protein